MPLEIQGCHGTPNLKFPDISLTIHWHCYNSPCRNSSVFLLNLSPRGSVKLFYQYFWHSTMWFSSHYPNIIGHNIHIVHMYFINLYCFHRIYPCFSFTNAKMRLCIPTFTMWHQQLVLSESHCVPSLKKSFSSKLLNTYSMYTLLGISDMQLNISI